MNLHFKSTITYVYISCQAILNIVQYYERGTDIQVLTKSNKYDNYLNTGVDVCLSILQAGIDRRVLLNAVDINGKLKLNGAANDILKISKSGWFNSIR